MAGLKFDIDPDPRKARMPPAALYRDPALFERQRTRLFRRTWHFVGTAAGLEEPGSARPVVLLPGCLDEPLVLVRDLGGELRALSNVCTHRRHLVVEGEWKLETLRCRYHGRRFHLDGTFAHMPGMESAVGFPSDDDSLARVPVAAWRGLVFVGLEPRGDPGEGTAPVEERLGALGALEWTHDPTLDFEVTVDANWALWCDNALEGMHAPHVHRALREDADLRPQSVVTWDGGSLRLAEAGPGEASFEPPPDHPDHGERIAAYHVFFFPATFLNVHPWGMLLHVVQPLGPHRSRVLFRFFAAPGSPLDASLANVVRGVAREDVQVVECVQRGLRGSLPKGRGRYAPGHERALHHFHRTLAKVLS